MSYCVNCGVELEKSEKYCPLCHVEVKNPKVPWQEPLERPYPKHLETLVKRMDRHYFATLSALILTIPILITIIYDFLSGGGLTWSTYIVGVAAMLFVFIVFPFYFKRYHTVIFLSADCAAVLLFLLFIEKMNGGEWFLGLGLPITVAASICIIVLAMLFTKKKRLMLLVKTASILIATGIFVLCVELIVNMNLFGAPVLRWSFYAFVPCLILSVMAFILEHRKNFKEGIRRRLFY